jgi:threonine dehydratase
MPSIAIRSKIEATKSYGATVIFSGPTSQEREAVAQRVIDERGAIFVSSANDPDIILGQGTVGLELEQQVRELVTAHPELSLHATTRDGDPDSKVQGSSRVGILNAIITPIGCGGLNSGVATFFASEPQTHVFGAEPSFEGGDDCCRGLAAGHRITAVKTLTIADGLRQPVGEIPWKIISDSSKVRMVYAVNEEQIKSAMKLVLEQTGVMLEPSAVVGLAVALYNEAFRRMVEQQAPGGWDVGVVLSGGNMNVKELLKMFGYESRSEGKENASI